MQQKNKNLLGLVSNLQPLSSHQRRRLGGGSSQVVAGADYSTKRIRSSSGAAAGLWGGHTRHLFIYSSVCLLLLFFSTGERAAEHISGVAASQKPPLFHSRTARAAGGRGYTRPRTPGDRHRTEAKHRPPPSGSSLTDDVRPPQDDGVQLVLDQRDSRRRCGHTSLSHAGCLNMAAGGHRIDDLPLFPGVTDHDPPGSPSPLAAAAEGLYVSRVSAPHRLKMHAPICSLLPADNSILLTSSYSRGRGADAAGAPRLR